MPRKPRQRMELPPGYKAFRSGWTSLAAYWHLRWSRGVAWDEPSAGRTITRHTVLGFMHARKLEAWQAHLDAQAQPMDLAGMDYDEAMQTLQAHGRLAEVGL